MLELTKKAADDQRIADATVKAIKVHRVASRHPLLNSPEQAPCTLSLSFSPRLLDTQRTHIHAVPGQEPRGQREARKGHQGSHIYAHDGEVPCSHLALHSCLFAPTNRR